MDAKLVHYEELFNEFAETIHKLSNGYDLFVQSHKETKDIVAAMHSQIDLLQQAVTSLRGLAEKIVILPEQARQQLDVYLQQLHQTLFTPIEKSVQAVDQLKAHLEQIAQLSNINPLLEQLRTYNAQLEVLQTRITQHAALQKEQLLPPIKEYLDQTSDHLNQEITKNLATIRDSIIEQYEHRLDNIATKLGTTLGGETKKILDAAETLLPTTLQQYERLFNAIENLSSTQARLVQQIQQILTQFDGAIQSTEKRHNELRTQIQNLKDLFETSINIQTNRYRDILDRFDKAEKAAERRYDELVQIANSLDRVLNSLSDIEIHAKETPKALDAIGKFISTVGERLQKIEQQVGNTRAQVEAVKASTQAISSTVIEKTDGIERHVIKHKYYLVAGTVAASAAVALLLYALIG